VSDEQPVHRRSGPLTILVGQVELTLVSSEVNTLIDGMREWRQMLSRQLDQLRRDKPQALEATTRRIGRIEQLEELLAGKSSRLGDPPLMFDADQTDLVQETLGEISGYQRGELTGGLKDLRMALYRL
jgi:hypothetical protein